MELSRALAIERKEVVAFVGGGGKTSAMFRLANELVAQGMRVVTTTTTRIFASQIRLAPHAIVAESRHRALREVLDAMQRHPHVLVIGASAEDGKAFGVEPDLVDELIVSGAIDCVLVEADGSRMRPFKAPNDQEPVIPQSTTLLVPVVGIDVVGKPLDGDHVHRPERVAQLLGVPPGTPLTPEHIAAVLTHPEGGLKNRPARARAIPFINKVENGEQLLEARAIAAFVLKDDSIEAAVTGALHNLRTPFSRRSRVSAVILAAGGSKRMQGALKQLLPWGATTLVQNALTTAGESGVSELVVVTGSHAEELERELTAHAPPSRDGSAMVLARNPDWSAGRASSVRAGIRALNSQSTAAIFINADQPFLTPAVIDTLLEAYYATGARIVVPDYNGEPGSPVLLARELFAELCALQGEQGGRDLLDKYRGEIELVKVADVRAGVDLDTPEEYQAARRGMGSERGNTVSGR